MNTAHSTTATFEQIARRLPEMETRGDVRQTGNVIDGCREWMKVITPGVIR